MKTSSSTAAQRMRGAAASLYSNTCTDPGPCAHLALKHVPQVSAAVGAGDLSADHAIGVVLVTINSAL